MKLVYNGKLAKLYLGDSSEFMDSRAASEFDITVTSPPYNTLAESASDRPGGVHANNKWLQSLRDAYDDDMPEPVYQAWCNMMAGKMMRVSKGITWINHKVRFRGQCIHPARFITHPIHSEVIWDRGMTINFNSSRYATSHEVVLGLGKPHYWDKSHDGLMTVWKLRPVQGDDRRGHPCPFPEEIPSRLIQSSCPVGGIVFDPFTGSGTTARAAIRCGRRFVGCERDERYIDAAIEGIKQAASDYRKQQKAAA